MREFKFCPMCSHLLTSINEGGRPRMACSKCGFINYRNPVVGVAVILLEGQRVLMGRRAGGKYGGGWDLPGGYVEWGEDIREAAKREVFEETGLQVEIGSVYAVHSNFHDPESLTVGIWFLGSAIGGKLCAGDDIDRVEFFSLDNLPDPLVFPTSIKVIEQLRKELEVTEPKVSQ